MRVTLDGQSYETPEQLTYRELAYLKKVSGYVPVNLVEGFLSGDAEFLCGFAAIAMRRAGREVDHEWLMDLDSGALVFEVDDEADGLEDDARPPADGGGAAE